MEYRHEIIPFSSQVPGKLFLHKLGSVPRHWHRSLEILVVLTGSVEIAVEDKRYTLHQTDICVINSLSPHEIYASNAEAVAFQTNPDKTAFGEVLKKSYFRCCSAGDTENPKYNRLRHLIARLIKENATEEKLLLSYSLIAELLYELQTNFSVPMPESMDGKRSALSQIGQVTDYMLQHFRENLSLQSVAEHFHYSASYLSRFFKQNLNMTFLEFYTSIRLESAVSDLISGNESINIIAEQNGFPSARSFVSVFQKKYGVLPSEYRQNHPVLGPQEKTKTEVNYLAVTNTSSLKALVPFLNEPQAAFQLQRRISKKNCGTVNVSGKSGSLTHNWRNVCCVGSSRDLLYENVRQMLRRAQKEIGYRYVKFHGILSDDLMIYDELSDGTVCLSFALLDQVLDFLLSIGLKPWMQLGFMPRALASNPKRNSFFTQQNCSLPKDIHKWNYLIESLVRHCIARYSLEEVLSWPFCVWNEPDTTEEMFGFADKEAFFAFYAATYRTVKRVHPEIRVGSPSLLFLLDDPMHWYRPFFEYCEKENCVPDFFNLHYYNDDITLDTHSGVTTYRERLVNRLHPDPDAFRKYLDELGKRLDKYSLSELPIYLTEWNLTVSHRNPINDTCFKACYLVKNLLENYDRLESFGYWSLTDAIGEMQLPEEIYHGGLGMFTVNQIPKAHYFTFRMLKKLGDTLVASGDGWFLTRHRSGKLSMILYNYYHYDQLVSAGELFDITSTERYTGFAEMAQKEFTMELAGMRNGLYRIEETFVNRQYGSSYDNWVAMGGMSSLNAEENSYLLAVSQPGKHVSTLRSQNDKLTIQCILEPLEVRLIEIEPLSEGQQS